MITDLVDGAMQREESSLYLKKKSNMAEKSFSIKKNNSEEPSFQPNSIFSSLKNVRLKSVSPQSITFWSLANSLMANMEKLLVVPNLEKEGAAHANFVSSKGLLCMEILETMGQMNSPFAKCFEAMHLVLKNFAFCQNDALIDILKEHSDQANHEHFESGKVSFMQLAYVLGAACQDFKEQKRNLEKEKERVSKEEEEGKAECEKMMNEFKEEVEGRLLKKKAELEMRLSMMTLEMRMMKEEYDEKKELNVEVLKDIMIANDEDATHEQIRVVLSKVRSLLDKNTELDIVIESRGCLLESFEFLWN